MGHNGRLPGQKSCNHPRIFSSSTATTFGQATGMSPAWRLAATPGPPQLPTLCRAAGVGAALGPGTLRRATDRSLMKAPLAKKPQRIVKPLGQLGPNRRGTVGRAMAGAVPSGGGQSHYLGNEHLGLSLLIPLDLLLLPPWAGLHQEPEDKGAPMT